jgi:DNA (cytosine-5)-methyltransferase 1
MDTKKKLVQSQGELVKGKTFCEFFAGIGLVRAGLEPSGWRCTYANDIEPKKRAMYEARVGVNDHFHLGDVNETDQVVGRIKGEPFLATASFPCIDLSLAGRYRGFDGEHSSTFFPFAEVLEKLGTRKPSVVMLENVKGFLTSHGGEDFKRVVRVLAGLGYWIDAFVLDACHFTPQSRPRVFVVGLVNDLVTQEAASPQDGDASASRCSSLRPDRIQKLKKTVQLPTGWVQFDLPRPPERTKTLADVIDQGDDQEWWSKDQVVRHYRMMNDRHKQRIDELLRSGQRWVGTIFRRIRDKQQRAEVRFDGLAGCLRTPAGGSTNQVVVTTEQGNFRMRSMSAREYARLQGADNLPLTGSRQNLLWGFIDAVCVPAIAWIDKHLLTPLHESASRAGRNGPASAA